MPRLSALARVVTTMATAPSAIEARLAAVTEPLLVEHRAELGDVADLPRAIARRGRSG